VFELRPRRWIVAMEYFSFEKVLKELQMNEDELKRLVSEGQIRAFRDDDRMKFRRDDIDGLKKGRQTEPTIILPPDGEDGSADDIMLVDDDTDETLLDLDDLGADDLGEADETAIPSLDLDDDDASSDTLTEELVFDDDIDDGDLTDEVSTQETLIDDEDDEIGMTTEPLDLDEDDEDEDDEKPKTVIAQRRQATVRASARSSGRAAAPIEEEEDITAGMVAITIAASLILFLAGLFFVDILREKFNPISGKIASMVQKNLSDDGNPKWFTDRDKKVASEDDEENLEDADGEEDEGEGEGEDG